jgi:hypothetical protein
MIEADGIDVDHGQEGRLVLFPILASCAVVVTCG